jgi:hypothetical protein
VGGEPTFADAAVNGEVAPISLKNSATASPLKFLSVKHLI